MEYSKVVEDLIDDCQFGVRAVVIFFGELVEIGLDLDFLSLDAKID